MIEPLLRVENLVKHFPVTSGLFGKVVAQVRAVDGVSFEIARGETLGLVGESGCGKTTVGRAVLRLTEPTSGRVIFDGADVTHASPKALRHLRERMQIIFQDPFSSLNPRLRVIDIVGEALEVHGIARGADVERRVAEILQRVGIPRSWINRYPHEFSGGQRQRIGIARAIALEPKLIVCDEAVSALDVSIQAQIVNLLIELRREMGLSYLFIAHDLSVVRHVSHRIAVMYLGQIVEMGPAERLFEAPSHPYTRALLSAIPAPDPRHRKRRLVLAGDVPTPLNPPPGCRFHTRCPAVMDRCREREPPDYDLEAGHFAKCFHAEGLERAPNYYQALAERIERRIAERAASAPPAAPSTVPAEPIGPATTSVVVDETPAATHGTIVIGAAVALAGALLVSLGEVLLGLAMLCGAYVALRPRGRSRRRNDALFLAACAAALVVARPIARVRSQHAARRSIERLSTELEAYAKLSGRYPDSLNDLGWRLYPLFDRGIPVDPWGKPFVYRAPGTNGHAFDVRSTGPDGIPSRDDIALPPK